MAGVKRQRASYEMKKVKGFSLFQLGLTNVGKRCKQCAPSKSLAVPRSGRWKVRGILVVWGSDRESMRGRERKGDRAAFTLGLKNL